MPAANSVGITIEFPFTTAGSFDFAIAAAQKFPSFAQYGKDKKAIYRVHFFEDEIEKSRELLEQLKGWRKRTVYLNGEKVPWDNVFGYSWCYNQKLASFKPEHYCFGNDNSWELNLWGCIRANLPLNENSELWSSGQCLNTSGDWEFDKDRIRHLLGNNLHTLKFCPALNVNHIEEVISCFPQGVNPNKDIDWKFVRSYRESGLNLLPVKVEKFGYESIDYMKGVAPNGGSFIEKIPKQLSRKLPDFIK